MGTKGARIRGRVVVLFLVTVIIMTGLGSYVYYIRHKEPTQGIFVYDQEMRREEIVSGHLYQSS